MRGNKRKKRSRMIDYPSIKRNPITMATNDKHCQTFIIKTPRNVTAPQNSPNAHRAQQMYDETVPVLNAQEVKSPSGSDSDSQELVAAMSKFNPPVRHTARKDLDSVSDDSDSDSLDNFLDNASDEDKIVIMEFARQRRETLTVQNALKSPDRQSYRPSNRPSAAAARRSPNTKKAVIRSSERSGLASRSPSRENPLKGSPDRLNQSRQSPDRKNLGRQSPGRENLDRQSPDRRNPMRRRSSERKIVAQRSPEGLRNRDKVAGKELEFGRSSRQQRKVVDSSDNSESDSNDLEMDRQPPAFPIAGGRKRGSGLVIPAEGAYDPKHFQDLKVSTDMENIFQYIMKYTPQKVDIEFKLQPFIPDYVPAVGDIDPFIKVTTPDCAVKGKPLSDKFLEHIDNLGLTVLDEPSAEQSDSALLHLQLRAFSKSNSAKSTVLTKKIEYAEKNPKSIERWIKDVSELHLSKPALNVNYTAKMPDIDSLMEEWPTTMEETLNEVSFPRPTIDCTLPEYAALVCGTFDIPLASEGLNDYIQALHVLFSLYLAVKNSQLYAERQKEDKNSAHV